MGDLFGIELMRGNRCGGLRDLHECRFAHLDDTRMSPILLVDEVRELPDAVLAEDRLRAATDFDSHGILNAVFAGDPSRHLPSPLTSPVCSSTCCKGPAIRRRYPRSEHDGRDRVAPGHGPLCGARSLRFGDVAHGVSLRPRSRPVTLGVHGGGHRHGCA